MNCAWEAFLNILPIRFRKDMDKPGNEDLLEVRLRLSHPPELVFADRTVTLRSVVTEEDLAQCIHFASQYSPWNAESISRGYITAHGGHRIGVFGRYTEDTGNHRWSLQTPAMLCIRIARDFSGISGEIDSLEGSVLIIGPPGSGKTTLLRDLIRQYSNKRTGNISVIDEREEIFPKYRDRFCFPAGVRTDVLSGCRKQVGIEWALRNMTPSVIAVDEITAKEDCDALLHAGWCGVNLIATAHAGSKHDLWTRPVYKQILEHNLFQTLLIMQPNKSWQAERINL